MAIVEPTPRRVFGNGGGFVAQPLVLTKVEVAEDANARIEHLFNQPWRLGVPVAPSGTTPRARSAGRMCCFPALPIAAVIVQFLGTRIARPALARKITAS